VRAWDLFVAGCAKLAGKSRPGRCVVLYYHEVPARERERFARQMDVLAHGAKVVPADYSGELESGKTFAAVTFDDGFVSVLENALPELQRHKMPATIFVPSGYLGQQPGWIKKGKKEWVMTPEQLRIARQGGLTIGSHTVKHPRLDRLPLDQAGCEMSVSKADLEKILQEPIDLLSVELVGDDELHISIGPVDLFDEPSVWGEVLANVARQIAQELERKDGKDPAATLRSISETFARESAKDPGDGE